MDYRDALREHKYYLSKYMWTESAQAMAERYRTALTEAGFSEATWPLEGRCLDPRNPLRFYRQDTDLTAFFVNLEPAGDGVRIFYGFGSTAFTRMRSNEKVLTEMGMNESDNTLRFLLSIRSWAVEEAAAEQITDLYRRYQGTEKDALLGIIKEKRKDWIARITAVLKPLGFRKKGNEWRKVLPSGHTLCFSADKGSYSDSYNFDVRLQAPPESPRPRDWCAFAIREQERDRALDPFRHHRFDWQLDPPEELDWVLNWFLTEYFHPLETLNAGGLSRILRCNRNECPVSDCPLRCTE